MEVVAKAKKWGNSLGVIIQMSSEYSDYLDRPSQKSNQVSVFAQKKKPFHG